MAGSAGGLKPWSTETHGKRAVKKTGRMMAIAHSHNITLQLISRVPLPAMPNEIGLETLEQTQWTVA